MNAIVTWATVIGGFATAITVIVALFAIWRESHESRFSLNTDILLRFYEQFNSDKMRMERRNAASALLDILEKGDTARIKLKSLEQILNYLELLGLLFKRGAIDKDSAKAIFSFWLSIYWQAVSSKLHPSKPPYIDEARRDNRLLWQHTQNMTSSIPFRSTRFSEQELRDFLNDETQLNEEVGKP